MANDRRLIDVDKILEELERAKNSLMEMGLGEAETIHTMTGLNMAQLSIATAPTIEASTVDAVEVVRCKDCVQWGGVAFGNVCRRWSAPLAGMKNCTGAEDFCSYGERRGKDAVD